MGTESKDNFLDFYTGKKVCTDVDRKVRRLPKKTEFTFTSCRQVVRKIQSKIYKLPLIQWDSEKRSVFVTVMEIERGMRMNGQEISTDRETKPIKGPTHVESIQ